MKGFWSYLAKLFWVFSMFLFWPNPLFSQKIQGPKGIILSLDSELGKAKNENLDTLSVYATYLEKIISRGNYIQADSILHLINNDLNSLKGSPTLFSIVKNRAYMYKVQQRYPKALEDYLFLKNQFEATHNLSELAEIYCLLAEYYRAIGEYGLCEKHLKEAKTLFTKFNPNKELLGYWFSRKAAWYNEAISGSDSVFFYAKEGYKLIEQTNDIQTKILLLNELGMNAVNRSASDDEIMDYLNRSKNLSFENERYRDYVDVVNNIAIYQYRYKDLHLAINLLEDILEIEKENNWHGPFQITNDYLSGLYRDTGDQEKATAAREQALLASIKNIQAIYEIKVSDLAFSYEKDLAAKELEVQSQKTQIAITEAKTNKRAFIITLAIGILLLGAAIISFQINLKFKKKNNLLNQQSNQIRRANVDLEKSLSQQKVLFKELNHRVKNNLSILTGLIYLQEVDENDQNFKKTLETLRHRIKSMAIAHESLYNSEEAEKIEFQPYLKSLFLDLKSAFSNSNKIETIIECEGFKLGLEQAVPLAMIVNELFTNSIKHGFRELSEGSIKVKAYHTTDYSIMEYSDNGVGFSPKQKKQRTLGLRLVNLLLEQLDATISDLSPERGVYFEIKIPSKPQAQ